MSDMPQISPTKKIAVLLPAVLSVLLVIGFFIWALAQPGTMGILRVNDTIRLAFIAAGLIAAAAVLTARLSISLNTRGRIRPGRFVAVVALIFAAPGLVGTPAAFAMLSGSAQPGIGDTPPQLFVTARPGIHGLPDIGVVFNTSRATINTLVWGKVVGTDDEITIVEPVAARAHAFLLTDLEPDTDYYYRLNNGEPRIFRTAPLTGSLRFAVGSDAHYGAITHNAHASTQMLSQISNPQNAFSYLFLVGDTTQWGFSKNHWNKALNALAQATSVVPLCFTPGNHDTMFSGLGNYQRFASPKSAVPEGEAATWMRIDIGRVHFFVIDLGWSAEAFTDNQADWLESELRTVPADHWKVVLGHGFTYASGISNRGRYRYDNPETIARLVPLFERYGVDLVFSGHNHQMEVLAKSGVTYVLSSPFGGVPSSERTYASPYSIWYESGQHGFADVTITGNEAVIVFRTPNGGEINRFDLIKNEY